MNKFKSYGFWTALAGAVVVLLNALGKCFGFSVEEEIVTDIIMAIAGVLVVFGIVSMPKDKTDEQNQIEENLKSEEESETEEENSGQATDENNLDKKSQENEEDVE